MNSLEQNQIFVQGIHVGQVNLAVVEGYMSDLRIEFVQGSGYIKEFVQGVGYYT